MCIGLLSARKNATRNDPATKLLSSARPQSLWNPRMTRNSPRQRGDTYLFPGRMRKIVHFHRTVLQLELRQMSFFSQRRSRPTRRNTRHERNTTTTTTATASEQLSTTASYQLGSNVGTTRNTHAAASLYAPASFLAWRPQAAGALSHVHRQRPDAPGPHELIIRFSIRVLRLTQTLTGRSADSENEQAKFIRLQGPQLLFWRI